MGQIVFPNSCQLQTINNRKARLRDCTLRRAFFVFFISICGVWLGHFVQVVFRLIPLGYAGKPSEPGGGNSRHGIGKPANLCQLLTAELFRLLAALHDLIHGTAAKNITRSGGIHSFQVCKSKHQSAGIFVGKVYALFAHCRQHQLHTEFFYQPPCPFFRGFVQQQFHFLFADFDHIRMLYTPQHLLCRFTFVLPQGRPIVGVKRNQRTRFPCNPHSFLCGAPGGLVRQREASEVKHLGTAKDAIPQIFFFQHHVSAGLTGKGECSVPGFVQCDKGQCGKITGVYGNSVGINSIFVQCANQHMPKSIVSHFPDKTGTGTTTCRCTEKITRCSSGISMHDWISIFIISFMYKINQKFAESHNIRHICAHPFHQFKKQTKASFPALS